MAAVLGRALYLVEGDTATLLLDFGDITDKTIYFSYETRTQVQLSPNGEHVAYLLDTETGADVLGYVNTQDGEHQVLKIAGDLRRSASKGEPSESMTSFVWMDNQSVVYTKLIGNSDQRLSELRRIDLKEGTETELAAGEIWQVLGVSEDGKRVYFVSGSYEDYSMHNSGEVATLNLDSGAITSGLLPGPKEGHRYLNFASVTLPDATSRILVTEAGPGMTVQLEQPKIWMVDPRDDSSTIIWTISRGKDLGTDVGYNCPRDFIWSASSESEFAYWTNGNGVDGVWVVDLQEDSAVQVVESVKQIPLAWSAEGIVTASFPEFDRLTLWSETGEVIGEIEF
jgi:hypothetical protein